MIYIRTIYWIKHYLEILVYMVIEFVTLFCCYNMRDFWRAFYSTTKTKHCQLEIEIINKVDKKTKIKPDILLL